MRFDSCQDMERSSSQMKIHGWGFQEQVQGWREGELTEVWEGNFNLGKEMWSKNDVV